MPLKVTVDSLEELDASVHGLYAEDPKTKKFVLGLEDIEAHPAVRGLTLAATDHKKKREELAARVAELEARVAEVPEDFDAETWVTLKAKAANPGDTAAEVQSVKELNDQQNARMKAKYEADLAAANKRIEDAERDRDSYVIGGGLEKALLSVGVDPFLLGGATALLMPSIKTGRNEQGKVQAVVETDLGEQPVEEFVKTWAQGKVGQRYLSLAEGPNAQGSRGANGSIAVNPFTAKHWNKTEQTKIEMSRREAMARAAGFRDYAEGLGATHAKT